MRPFCRMKKPILLPLGGFYVEMNTFFALIPLWPSMMLLPLHFPPNSSTFNFLEKKKSGCTIFGVLLLKVHFKLFQFKPLSSKVLIQLAAEHNCMPLLTGIQFVKKGVLSFLNFSFVQESL